MTILLDSELRQLLDSPRLPFIARKIDAVLADSRYRCEPSSIRRSIDRPCRLSSQADEAENLSP